MDKSTTKPVGHASTVIELPLYFIAPADCRQLVPRCSSFLANTTDTSSSSFEYGAVCGRTRSGKMYATASGEEGR
jgi:hypothetical protein